MTNNGKNIVKALKELTFNEAKQRLEQISQTYNHTNMCTQYDLDCITRILEYIDHESISKNRIRDEIEQLEQETFGREKQFSEETEFSIQLVGRCTIDILKELMGDK